MAQTEEHVHKKERGLRVKCPQDPPERTVLAKVAASCLISRAPCFFAGN